MVGACDILGLKINRNILVKKTDLTNKRPQKGFITEEQHETTNNYENIK